MLFSPLTPQQRVLLNVAMVMVPVAILVCVVLFGAIIEEKAQVSGDFSKKPTLSTLTVSNAGNRGVPLILGNAGGNFPTNVAVPVPPPFLSVTNSN